MYIYGFYHVGYIESKASDCGMYIALYRYGSCNIHSISEKDSAVIVSDDSVSDSILQEAQRLTKHKMIVAGKQTEAKLQMMQPKQWI